MVIVRLGRLKRLATFSLATAASLWAVEHYSDANSLWSSFRVVRFGRAAIAVRYTIDTTPSGLVVFILCDVFPSLHNSLSSSLILS